jgi:hypothetical protein
MYGCNNNVERVFDSLLPLILTSRNSNECVRMRRVCLSMNKGIGSPQSDFSIT